MQERRITTLQLAGFVTPNKALHTIQVRHKTANGSHRFTRLWMMDGTLVI
jgi:hypothetical protein